MIIKKALTSLSLCQHISSGDELIHSEEITSDNKERPDSAASHSKPNAFVKDLPIKRMYTRPSLESRPGRLQFQKLTLQANKLPQKMNKHTQLKSNLISTVSSNDAECAIFRPLIDIFFLTSTTGEEISEIKLATSILRPLVSS